jgi:hypothetical protein
MYSLDVSLHVLNKKGRRKSSCSQFGSRMIPKGKKTAGRPGRRWEDNIKMTLEAASWLDVDWIHLAQDGNPL